MVTTIDVGPADLAASRFAVAPLSELDVLLRRIDGPRTSTARAGPGSTARWVERFRPLAGTLDTRLLRALRPPGGWGPDLIAPPPRGLTETVESALETVRATPAPIVVDQVRRALDLSRGVDRDVRAALTGPGAADRIATALDRLWHALIAPDWPTLLAVAERDVLHRGRTLVEKGWSAALQGLHDDLSWHDGRILVRRRNDDAIDLAGRGLHLVPSVFVYPGLVVYSEAPWQPTLVYPARGSAVLWERSPVPDAALARLLGRSRATLLVHLAEPASTSQLVQLTGFALGAVGDHLRVLHDAGLVTRARAGRSVVYRRTPVGEALAAVAAR